MVGLQFVAMKDVLEHGPVLLGCGAGQIGHQVYVHLEAANLQQLRRLHGRLPAVAPVDIAEHVVVSVLHADLNAGASEFPQEPKLVHGNVVRPRLQGKSNDFHDGPLVLLLLFEQRPTRPNVGRSLLALPELALHLVECVGGVKQVAAEFFLVVPRVAGPGATEYNDLNLVNGMALLRERAGSVVKLPYGVKLVLICPCYRRLGRQVGPRLARLVRAVIAILGARKPARGCDDRYDHDARIRTHSLFRVDAFERRVPLYAA
mmetsp:Transcript_31851/g.88026  ORF Transcript_31851/g.88026 Transcript_31851/m.88026 type:complete len:261 (-) Transcript_31851:294-1076(-)